MDYPGKQPISTMDFLQLCPRDVILYWCSFLKERDLLSLRRLNKPWNTAMSEGPWLPHWNKIVQTSAYGAEFRSQVLTENKGALWKVTSTCVVNQMYSELLRFKKTLIFVEFIQFECVHNVRSGIHTK